jgi:hypothetical protein
MMTRLTGIQAPIYGRELDLALLDESDNYEICPACGDAFHVGNFAAVMYHDATDYHEPLNTLH